MSNVNTKEKKDIRPFGLRDKLAYGAGDFGCNMSFALKGTLVIFWTQFMELDTILYSILFAIVQIWDAINDPLIGGLIDADKRKYKLGKFRTYIFIGSIGLLFAGALCFLPFKEASPIAKNLIFIAGYVLWDAFYTVANVPYGSMLPLISSDTKDKAQLSSWRSAGGIIGQAICMVLLPFIIYDENDNIIGERVFIVALIMGIIGFFAFQFMIRNTVERVEVDVKCKEDTPKFNFFKACKNFFTNRPVLGATLAPVAMFLGQSGATTAATVMFQSYFHKASLSGVVTILGIAPLFICMPFVKKIVTKWGKKEASAVTSILSIVSCVLMLVLPITPDITGIILFTICQILNGLGQAVYQCVSYSMMGDAIDYNEWKHGVRDEGTTYALHSFFRKLAQSIGPSVCLVIATALGYIAKNGSEQTPEVAKSMLYLYIGMTLFGTVLKWIAIALVYNVDKKMVEQMKEELTERHNAEKAGTQVLMEE